MTLATDVQRYLGHPRVGMATVRIGQGVLAELDGVVSALNVTGPIALLVDESEILDGTGRKVKQVVHAMLARSAEVSVVSLGVGVHADELTVQHAVQACAAAALVVTVGSGTLCDIGKVASAGRPHIVVQTAASVNGFADDQSVLLVSGVKRTTATAWPHTILVDSAVLQAAPPELNRSGLGDMISMFTAPADWYLASLVGMDRGWSPEAATLTRQYGDDLLGIADGVNAAAPVALATLANFLTLSGISMGVAGQTSPSSGMEHTVSHLLDMAKSADGFTNDFHGAQVGVATVVVATLWRRMARRIADGSLGAVLLPDDETAERLVRAAFDRLDATGATSDECWNDYSKKLTHLRESGAAEQIEVAVARWAEHAPIFDSLLESPERIAGALRSAGAPAQFDELEHSRSMDEVVWALTNCHLMRNRFTIADLAFLTGWWDAEEIAAVLAEATGIAARR